MSNKMDNANAPIPAPKATGNSSNNDFLMCLNRFAVASIVSSNMPMIMAIVPPLTPGMTAPMPTKNPLKKFFAVIFIVNTLKSPFLKKSL